MPALQGGQGQPYSRFQWCAQGVVEALVAGPEQQHRGVLAKQLHASMATINPSLQSTNLLHELDSVTQEVISAISAAQVLADTCRLFDGECLQLNSCLAHVRMLSSMVFCTSGNC